MAPLALPARSCGRSFWRSSHVRPPVRTLVVIQRDPLYVIGRGSFVHVSTDSNGLPGDGLDVLGIEAGRLPADSQLKLLLRPDDLRYQAGSSLSLPVLSRAFEGAYYRYELGLPDGQRVTCIAPSHVDLADGALMSVCLDLRHLVYFPAALSDAS